MRAPWRKLCLLLLVLCLLSAVAMKQSKKNKKSKDASPSEDHSKGKSAKKETATGVNPKIKPAIWLPHKKAKPTNSPLDTPIITEEILGIQVPQVAAPDTQAQVFTKETKGHPSSDNCSSPLQGSGSLWGLEKDVTALWSRVGALSQPVHIHVHGGHMSPSSSRGRQGCRGRCHGDGSHKRHRESKDRDKPRPRPAIRDDDFNTTEHHGSVNDSSSQESHHNHSPRRHHDHSPRRHHDHSHSRHHHSHKSHGHSHTRHHHYSHEQRTDNPEGHNDSRHHGHSPRGERGHGHDLKQPRNRSQGGHKHGGEGHTEHRGYGNKCGRGGHSLSRGHGEGRGRNRDEDRGHSTHVHIHVTVDEKPGQHDLRQTPPDAKASSDDDVLHARCDIRNHDAEQHLDGYVLLRQQNDTLQVKVNISGFPVSPSGEAALDTDTPSPAPPAYHGFHVHEFGDFRKGCLSFGSHYNPENLSHGGLEHDHRHVGDWGNLEVDDQGVAVAFFSVTDATLVGKHSIVGRGIVVHGQADDLGQGETEASKATGNAGARLACCVVARSQPVPDDEFWSPVPSLLQPEPTPFDLRI